MYGIVDYSLVGVVSLICRLPNSSLVCLSKILNFFFFFFCGYQLSNQYRKPVVIALFLSVSSDMYQVQLLPDEARASVI